MVENILEVMKQDVFAEFLGIEIVEAGEGTAKGY
jgi:hypothetical protein